MVGFAAELQPPDRVGEPRAARPRDWEQRPSAARFDSTRPTERGVRKFRHEPTKM
jgi:hypothetical protein